MALKREMLNHGDLISKSDEQIIGIVIKPDTKDKEPFVIFYLKEHFEKLMNGYVDLFIKNLIENLFDKQPLDYIDNYLHLYRRFYVKEPFIATDPPNDPMFHNIYTYHQAQQQFLQEELELSKQRESYINRYLKGV